MKTSQIVLATLVFLVPAFTMSAAAEPPAEAGSAPLPEMVVYHDPACGCCGKWMAHMREAGFVVRSETGSDLRLIKQQSNVPASLQSCHTAVVGGYVIEGHIPASDVKRLLAEQPDVAGIAVPGMPMGSPGMEYGNKRQAFDVVSFDKAGGTGIFNHYPAITEVKDSRL